MPGIFHDFFIKAPPEKVFGMISTPEGIDKWWAKMSSGQPAIGAAFKFDFGPEYQWTAKVSKSEMYSAFEFTMQQSDADWSGTKVGFQLSRIPEGTGVKFYHTGWPTFNEHYRISTFCWAMYLRLLKLNLETGLFVEYDKRLEV